MTKVVENNNQMNGSLPIGWEIAQVKDVCDIIRGVSYKKVDSIREAQKGYLPILRATNIQDNSLILDKDLVYVPSNQISEHQRLKIGDIVIATSSGSKHLVGKTAQVKEKWYGAFGAFCAAIRSTVEIDYRYLGYFFNSPAYKDVIAAKAMGVNINNLRRGDIEELKIPLAPINEQKRIVAEIEKQFSRLDEAVENLKRVKANLKRYKASVLKAAVEGKLTEEWRKKHPDIESADKLLERILTERRKKWEEAELAKMKAKGKEPKDGKWKGKYKEPAKPDLNDLPKLPGGWIWVNIDQLILLLTDYHANGSYKILKKHVTILDEDAYAIYVRATNLKMNKFDSDLKFVDKKAYDFLSKSKIYGNEIIIGKIGNAGKVYYMPKLDQPCTLGMNLFMLRFNQFLSDKYIYYHLMSFFSEQEIKSKVKGVGNPSIDKNGIRSLRIAFPSIKEQNQIITAVDEQMSLIAHFEGEIERYLFRADRLRQSILKKAFSGKLIQNKEL